MCHRQHARARRPLGGNAAILAQAEVTVYAPKAEADVIRRPRFEPEYLWQGAAPFEALRNKFLLADASPVHVDLQGGQTFAIGDVEFQCVPLPGHAHGQLGIRVDGVFFAADGYFDPPVVDKLGLPYMVNYTETLESAKSIPAVDAEWVVPGMAYRQRMRANQSRISSIDTSLHTPRSCSWCKVSHWDWTPWCNACATRSSSLRPTLAVGC
nr:MBL fold metallo-hydrolase [Alicyclobacillus pomorum]